MGFPKRFPTSFPFFPLSFPYMFIPHMYFLIYPGLLILYCDKDIPVCFLKKRPKDD